MEKFIRILKKILLIALMVGLGFGALVVIGYTINYTNQINTSKENLKIKAFRSGKTLMCQDNPNSRKYHAYNRENISLIGYDLYLDNREPIKLDKCKVVN